MSLQSTQSRARTESPEREHKEILRRKGRRFLKLRAGDPGRERKGMRIAKIGGMLGEKSWEDWEKRAGNPLREEKGILGAKSRKY